MVLQQVTDLASYLEPSEVIDFDHASIQEFVRSTGLKQLSEIDRARQAFLFVRDEVSHSRDVNSRRVTCKASEVLEHRVGICYAKSHLLAALLRASGLPAGICYQRLTLLDDASGGHAIHALNAVFFSELDRWVRVDARGNKPGVDAQFDLDREQLAFPIRPEMDEVDYGLIHAVPVVCTLEALASSDDMMEIYYRGLPSDMAF